MPVRHAILGLLTERPRHGYELKTGFDQLTAGQWDLNVGQVYSTLDRLRKEGLVRLDERSSSDDRKIYRITPEGLADFETWMESPPLEPRPLRDELFVRLSLLLPENVPAVFELIETQRRVYRLHLADLTRQKVALGRLDLPDRLRRELVLDAALHHVAADLKWLDTCEEKVLAWNQENGANKEEGAS